MPGPLGALLPQARGVLGEILQIREQVHDDVQAQQADQADQVRPQKRREQEAVEEPHGERPPPLGGKSEIRNPKSETNPKPK